MTRKQLYALCTQIVHKTKPYEFSSIRKQAALHEAEYRKRTLSVLMVEHRMTACVYRGACYIFPLDSDTCANVQGNIISKFASDKGAKTKVRLYPNPARLLFTDEQGDVKGDYYCLSAQDCDYADVIPIPYRRLK